MSLGRDQREECTKAHAKASKLWPMSLHFSGNGLEPNDEDRIRIVLPGTRHRGLGQEAATIASAV